MDKQRPIFTNQRGNNPDKGAGKGVLVIGAGISGLTSALCLRQEGFEVTVIAELFAPRVTSVVAGALWEWPPAVCGHHHDLVSLARSKPWCETSYEIFADLAGDPATGVFFRPVTFYFKRPIAEDRWQREKMAELAGKVRQFKHDPSLIPANGINPELGLCDAYTHLAPMVDTDVYMHWLLGEVRRAGCRIIQRRLAGSLREQEEALEREYGVDAIVNCTGLGAVELTGEPMHPLRGALIRVRNDGGSMPRVTQAHCVSHDGSSEEPGFIFIVPRGEDMLILGGLAEPDEWGLDIGLHNYEPIRAMHRRCLEFMPALKNAEIDAAEPVRVGLRPFRSPSVRLEPEAGTRIVHNYGHGGSGVTFSWGCALEVVEQVGELVLQTPASLNTLPAQSSGEKHERR
ncbi:MAG: FAD-dependent oxidoreductase [Isosphaerales bacterium]